MFRTVVDLRLLEIENTDTVEYTVIQEIFACDY